MSRIYSSQTIFTLVLLILVLILSSCGRVRSNGLMDDASPRENGWDSTLLSPVDIDFDSPDFILILDMDVSPPPSVGEGGELVDEGMEVACVTDISMTLVDWDREHVTVIFSNDGNGHWMYGEHFSLHVLLNHQWFYVPPLPDHAFVDIGLIIQANEEVEHIYHLGMYGDLPEGRYRLVAYGLYVEFDL